MRGDRLDVVVVGSGIAGLIAALDANDAGCRVVLVTKRHLADANTTWAQGGIAAVLSEDDSIDAHARDTIVAGAGLADPSAVRVLVEEGPQRLRELVARGVRFDRTPDGELVRGLEAAHSHARILHAGGDATGAEIERALLAQLAASDIEVREHRFLIDLVVEDARVRGIDALGPTGARERIRADAVVLATGGACAVYAHTTNPDTATGDGIAAAIRAGAAVADLEFVQFHPTVLAVGDPFLISEAVRGEGAVLLDERGHRFAFDAHPDGELAPRDVVARAIASAMSRQGGRPVVLDATARERAAPGFLARRFPTIDRVLRERGCEWSREVVPVMPAAHYLMGGIVTDLDGRTTLPGLYAVGETARTGVHGANRLASNSLLEGAVFGTRAARAIVRDASSPLRSGAETSSAGGLLPARPSRHPATTVGELRVDRDRLRALMWEHAGLIRDGAGLAHAATQLARWRGDARRGASVREHEDANLLLVATRIVDAAARRSRSVGAHHRGDEPPVLPRADVHVHDTAPRDAGSVPAVALTSGAA